MQLSQAFNQSPWTIRLMSTSTTDYIRCRKRDRLTPGFVPAAFTYTPESEATLQLLANAYTQIARQNLLPVSDTFGDWGYRAGAAGLWVTYRGQPVATLPSAILEGRHAPELAALCRAMCRLIEIVNMQPIYFDC